MLYILDTFSTTVPRICIHKTQQHHHHQPPEKIMSARYSILASVLHTNSHLPRTSPLNRAAVSEILLPKPGRTDRWRTTPFRALNCTPSPPRGLRFPILHSLKNGGGRGGESLAPVLPGLGFRQESSRAPLQSLPGRETVVYSGFLIRRRAGGVRRMGAAAESELHETASTAPGTSGARSEEYKQGGKYCVLLTGHASGYTEKLYGGYGQMFIKLLGDRYETWDIYAVVDGQFPSEEELEKYDGFVITGSRHDAHGSEKWIAELCALLEKLYEKKRNTLGVCFGHQVLSRALGGRTGKAAVGWEIGLREIQTTPALASKSYAFGFPPVFKVLTVHQDQVQEVPPGGELLGFSEKTGIEIFAVGDHTLGIQGHPEFTEDVVKDLIDSRLGMGILTEKEAKDARATIQAGQADQEALVKLCKSFLKRRS